jgi:hypothetical protein
MARSSPPFGLDSLLLTAALVAACLVVMGESQFLGIPLSVLSACALVRTRLQIANRHSDGSRMAAFDKVIAFFVSVAIVLIIGAPAIVSLVLSLRLCAVYEVPPLLRLAVSLGAGGGAGYGTYRLVNDALASTREPSFQRRAWRIPPMTTRNLMIVIAILALLLWLVHQGMRRPHYDRQADFHFFMYDLCFHEADLMKRRADACRSHARSNSPWDDTGDETRDLKCCPYLEDVPRSQSWVEQAAVWERAARKASNAAEWHSRAQEYYRGWSPIAPPGLLRAQ